MMYDAEYYRKVRERREAEVLRHREEVRRRQVAKEFYEGARQRGDKEAMAHYEVLWKM